MLQLLLRNAVVAAAYFVGAVICVRMVVIHGHVSPVWLPSGVALYAVVRLGRGVAPGVFLGALLATLLSGTAFFPGVGMALGNALEPLVGAFLLERVFRFRPSLDRVRDALGLFFASSLVSTCVSAVCGVSALVACGLLPASAAMKAGGVWWLGDAIGALITAPALLTLWGFPWPRVDRARALEILGLAAFLGLASLAVFGGFFPEDKTLKTQAFLLFPPALWAAMRFGPRGAAISTLFIDGIAVWATVVGVGPFAEQVVVDGVVILQVFMAVLTVTSLLLAAALSERESADAHSRLLVTALQDTHEGILLTDAQVDGEGPKVLYANDGLARLMGSSPGILVGRPLWLFDGSGAGSPQRALLEAALRTGRSFLGEWVLPKSGAEHAITELQMSPVLVQGRLSQFVFTFRDVTERKQMEGKLVLSERMASVGLVAAGLGHEINNPLSFVLTNLQVLEEELDILRTSDRATLARLRDCVHDALHGARRVRQIVRSLKVLSRDAAQERSIVQLDKMVELTLALSGPTLRQRAEVVTSLGRTPQVEGNEARLGQVLLNLLLNAMQAIPERARPGRIEVSTGTDAQGNAFLEVRDSGSGIPDGALSRLFEPFFTTKPAGEGTGLGLFICRQIVDEHGGRIDVETAPGEGSCFRILLPPAQGGLPVEVARTEVRRGRILVVDDEVRLAASIRMLLSPMHDAETCPGGQEALDHLAKGGEYDVILCDLQMPQVSGVEFFQRLGALRPELTPRFVFMSGGAWSEEAREFVRRTSNVVLEKPVPPDVLMRVVEEGVHRVYPSE